MLIHGGFILNFSISGLISGFLFGVIGLWILRRGKIDSNLHLMLIGLALMIYPYFTSGPWGDWAPGIALCGLAYYIWDR